jgi:glutamyl-tRNA reductase
MEAVGPLDGRQVLVIGAGSMSALAGATLRRAGATKVVVANRTPDNARRLATSLDGVGIGLDQVEDVLATADVVVSCTGATGLVLEADLVERAVKARDGRPIAFLDLALPRDVDPAVRGLAGVTLVDLASLQEVLEQTETGADVEAARGIVHTEVAAFLAEQLASRVAPTVVALRSRADEVVAAELARLTGRLPDLAPDARAEVEQAVRRVVDKLLHTPTVRVKELTEAPEGLSYADALRELFGLDRTAPAAVALAPVEVEDVDG